MRLLGIVVIVVAAAWGIASPSLDGLRGQHVAPAPRHALAAPGGGQGPPPSGQSAAVKHQIQVILAAVNAGVTTPEDGDAQITALLTAWLDLIIQRFTQAMQNDVLFESRLADYVDWQATVDLGVTLDKAGYLASVQDRIDAADLAAAYAWDYALHESDARCLQLRDWRKFQRVQTLLILAQQSYVEPSVAGLDYLTLLTELLDTNPCLRVTVTAITVSSPLEAGQPRTLTVLAGVTWRDGVYTIHEDIKLSLEAEGASLGATTGVTHNGVFQTQITASGAADPVAVGVSPQLEAAPLVGDETFEYFPLSGATHTPTATPTQPSTATPTPTAASTQSATATATVTSTPTPTSTSSATGTTTSSPTASPTSTATATPTATPTPPTPGPQCFYVGGPMEIIPAAPIGTTFYATTIEVPFEAGGRVVVAGSCEGSGWFAVDDVLMASSLWGDLWQDFSHGCSGIIQGEYAIDITDLVRPGVTSVNFEMRELCGGGSGSTTIYLVVFPP